MATEGLTLNMKVIVAGGRDFVPADGDGAWLADTLAELKATEVVSGCARGADKFGEEIAEAVGLRVRKFPAEWEEHGRAAGVIRNQQMADYADALIVFPGGKGTIDMESRALQQELDVIYRT